MAVSTLLCLTAAESLERSGPESVTKFQSLLLSLGDFALSYVANICICVIMDDFFAWLPA